MTQPITTRGGWKARLGQIADAYPQAAGLLRRGTLARDLWSLSPHSPTFCRDVLALLQPALGVPPQKAQPWLLALYQHLADQRFPDEARGHPRRPFSPEEALYLALLDLALQHRPDPFDPLMDLLPLPPESLDHNPTAADYQRFLQVAQEEHILALFTLGRELMPFDPAAHTIGVHNVALHTAILARQAGLPVDLPLVRAAAFGHDLGKFGCRGAEAQRIPYLHYYYTWQWFREHGLESIGHISANHSTWDLECENLPMESLLLIYADFRVRGQRDENGREHMAIYTLDQARDLIFSKLADMTPAKQRRYETVYRKLRDFEHYLRAHGVPTDLEEDQLRPVTHTDPALLFPEGALERLRDLTFANSIRLMATVAASEPFAQLLERAKGAKNTQSIRTYLHLLEEYNTYMTASNRRKTLALLYELLMHPEGDVRRKAGQIMGQILANSEIQSQKERPASASEMPPAMVELLEEAVNLWEHYILQCLHPDRKVAAKHAQRIANSLKVICRSLFQHCTREEAQPFLPPLLRQLWQAEGAREQFILADALCQVPLAWLPAEALPPTAAALGRMLQAGQGSLALAALRCLEQLRLQRPEDGAGAAWARSSPTSLAAATKKGWRICRRIPTPSPVWPEASFPARCSRCSTISRASSTVWREGRPHRSTTAPMPQASCPRFSGFILHICSLIDSHPIHQSHKNGTRFWMASQPTQKKQHPFSEVFTWFSPVFSTVILHFLHNFPSFSAMHPACSRAPFPLLPLSFFA